MNLENLYKKYPFIYKVEDKYYYLGWGICNECTSEIAIHYYEKYIELIKKIGEDTLATKGHNMGDAELDNLLYLFRKVMAYSDIEVKEEEMHGFKKKLNAFLETNSETQNIELEKQLTNFIHVFYYYYRRNE